MLIRQTLHYLPAQLIGPLFQFVAVVVWTHALPPSDYGLISLVLAVQELAFLVCLSWWTHYTMRYLPSLATHEAYQRSENAVLVGSSLLQCPIVLLGLVWTGHLGDGTLVAATLLYTVSRTLTTHVGERARALGDVATYTIAQTAGPVLGFALGMALLRQWPGASAVLLGFAAVQIVLLPYLARRLELPFRLSLRPDDRTLRAALIYGGPLLVAGGLGWLSANGIRLVVEHREGLVALGLLSVGWNLGQRLMAVVATLVSAAAYPLAVRRMQHGGAQEGLAQISRNGILLFGLILPAALGLIAITMPLTELLVGPEFRDATLVVLPLAAAAAALRNLRVHLADQAFLLLERPRFLVLVNTIEALATILLCWLGLVWGGLAGACLGCLAAHGGSAILCFAVAVARHRLDLPVAAGVRLAVAALAMVLVVRLGIYPATPLGLAIQIAAGGVVYVGTALLMLRAMLPTATLGRLRSRA